MNLFEIFDLEADIQWMSFGWGERGGFLLNDQPFVIELHKIALPGARGLTIVEVSFYRHDVKGDGAYGTTNQTTMPSGVYGVVSNAVAKKAEAYDGFFFTTEHRHGPGEAHGQRVKIYRYLAHRIARRTGLTLWDRERYGGHEFLLVKHNPGSEWKNERADEGLTFAVANKVTT